MMDYWSGNNVEAVEDLSGLAHYRAMSASLKSSAYFYYYGDRNEEGRPEGTGIAVYGEDQYYYGEWKDGFRSGQGMWIKMYYGDGKAADVDPAFVSHSYEGAWLNNLPNGEGHERYDLDAVSYTHLDVYKRQKLTSMKASRPIRSALSRREILLLERYRGTRRKMATPQ